MLVLKRGKIIKSQKIKEDDGELIKEIEEEFMNILELLKLKNERNLPEKIFKKSPSFFTFGTKSLQQAINFELYL